MPKKSKKRISSNISSFFPDGLTLNDFANNHAVNSSGKSRLKKGTSNSLGLSVRPIVQDSSEEKDWDSKNLDDFDIENIKLPALRVKTRRKKCSTSTLNACSEKNPGDVYPLDLWFILSRYIRPEDIGRFSEICRFSYEVTESSSFWTKLYKRYYSDLIVLPLRLQPASLERLYERRTCVIRSLFYLYPGFIERLKNNQIDPNVLIKRTCIMVWHQKGRGVYHYYFKMQESNVNNNSERVSLKNLSTDDLIHELGNINANPEKGCRVLQVTTATFIAIPPTIYGEKLLEVSLTLSCVLRNQNLMLIFGPSHGLQCRKENFTNLPEGTVRISLNSVIVIKVLDWWNPSYPYSIDSPHECN